MAAWGKGDLHHVESPTPLPAGQPQAGVSTGPTETPSAAIQLQCCGMGWAALICSFLLGGNKIKRLARRCWLGAPLGVLVSLRGMEETHVQGARHPGSVRAWGCLS